MYVTYWPEADITGLAAGFEAGFADDFVALDDAIGPLPPL